MKKRAPISGDAASSVARDASSAFTLPNRTAVSSRGAREYGFLPMIFIISVCPWEGKVSPSGLFFALTPGRWGVASGIRGTFRMHGDDE